MAVLYPAQVIPYGMHGMGGGFHGMGMDSMEWGMDSILLVDGFHGMGDGFHTFSRWIPYIFHGMGDGLNNFFYLFHKSRLKIYMVGIKDW